LQCVEEFDGCQRKHGVGGSEFLGVVDKPHYEVFVDGIPKF
jgi:hypothetical protein